MGGERLKKVIALAVIIASLITVAPAFAQLPGENKMGLTVKWHFNTSAAFEGKSFWAGHVGGIAVYDCDNDGINEIYFGTRRGDSKRLWCLGPDGTLSWIFPPIADDGLPGDPTTKESFIDVNNDGTYDVTEQSSIYVDTERVTNPFSLTVDILDGTPEIKFSILVYDDDIDASDVIDYTPTTAGTAYAHLVTSPFTGSWSYDGDDDGLSEIDCELEYSISVTA